MTEQLYGLAAKLAREQAAREQGLASQAQAPQAGTAAYSLSEAGVPVQTGVPDDFAAAHEAAVVNSGQLTAEEIAEFRALRAEKKERDRLAAEEAAAAAARLQAPTHHVHLADGTILQGSSIATHYALEDGRVVAVSGAYELAPSFPL